MRLHHGRTRLQRVSVINARTFHRVASKRNYTISHFGADRLGPFISRTFSPIRKWGRPSVHTGGGSNRSQWRTTASSDFASIWRLL